MTGVLAQVLQVVGALLVLSAYALAQARRLRDTSRTYLATNLAGGAVLAVLALLGRDWGFLVLEGSWALISLRGLVRTFAKSGGFLRFRDDLVWTKEWSE